MKRVLVSFTSGLLVIMIGGCVSTENQGERLEHAGELNVTQWTAVNLVFETPSRFIRGRAQTVDEVGDGFNVLYPAANEAMFAAAVLGHAVAGATLLEARQNELQREADEVLEGAEAVFSNINPQIAELRLAQALEAKSGIVAYPASSAKEGIPSFKTEPYFALAQSRDRIQIENLVVLTVDDADVYINRIELLSRTFNLSTLNSMTERESLADRLLYLYTQTNMVALRDASGLTSSHQDTPITWKIAFGEHVEYQRATFLMELEGFAVLRKLGGNLLLVPEESLSPG